jgi:hypothetical protein
MKSPYPANAPDQKRAGAEVIIISLMLPSSVSGCYADVLRGQDQGSFGGGLGSPFFLLSVG